MGITSPLEAEIYTILPDFCGLTPRFALPQDLQKYDLEKVPKIDFLINNQLLELCVFRLAAAQHNCF
jgi:hypothetical protein